MNRQIIRPPFNKKRIHIINDEILHPFLRIIGDEMQGKVFPKEEALQIALSSGRDLILISDNANPPIAKIEDYNKFLYNQKKSDKERKKNSTKIETKEIQLSCTISDNDLNTKAKKAKEILLDENKVKCIIQLKGRQKGMPEQGELVMIKFADILLEVGSPETMPKMEGSKWMMILKPKIKKSM